jgi:hypothetical protein
MKILRSESFEKAKDYLKAKARPLEQALFSLHFENGSAKAVKTALAAFQNPDGGFGHGLEADIRAPVSSAVATDFGLEILAAIGSDTHDEMVQKTVAYLLGNINRENSVWRVIPPEANDYPHAPWWSDDETGKLAHTFDDFLIIPRAKLLGLLWHYAPLVPADWLEALTETTVHAIETIPALGTGGGDDLRYTLLLAEEPGLPQAFRTRIIQRVEIAIPETVSRDPQEWSGYTPRPLKFVSGPESLTVKLMRDAVEQNLDYLIDEQTAGGYWDPVWDWGGAYPEDWQGAQTEWRGHLTLSALEILQKFGRIAN